MNVLLHLITYACLAVFIIAVAVRYFRIQKYPLHIRWEIYPLPHEGKRSEYGGSRMEETDWWTKERKRDRVRELKFMIQEMVFIKALYENNRKLWFRSFPFHFGLYLLAGFVGGLVVTAILEMLGMDMTAGLGGLLAFLTAVVGLFGLALGIVGGIGLIQARLTDVDLLPYTTKSHIFNLVFILVVEALALLVWLTGDKSFAELRGFVASVITFGAADFAGAGFLLWITIALTALLIAYIPLTHMSHFFVKWFTWHKIRWDDEPNVRGGRIEKMIENALQYPVSWSADHIRGDGTRTWADIATEEISKSE